MYQVDQLLLRSLAVVVRVFFFFFCFLDVTVTERFIFSILICSLCVVIDHDRRQNWSWGGRGQWDEGLVAPGDELRHSTGDLAGDTSGSVSCFSFL